MQYRLVLPVRVIYRARETCSRTDRGGSGTDTEGPYFCPPTGGAIRTIGLGNALRQGSSLGKTGTSREGLHAVCSTTPGVLHTVLGVTRQYTSGFRSETDSGNIEWILSPNNDRKSMSKMPAVLVIDTFKS